MLLIILITYVLIKPYEITAEKISLPNDFHNLTEELYFVDKTELIRSIYYQPNKFIYISRPRKYGKSMNLNMIKLFFNVQVDKQGEVKNYTRTSAYLRTFRHLHVGNDMQFVQEHIANYPVILLDLKYIDNIVLEEINEQTVLKYLNILLYETFKSYQWLLDIPREKLLGNCSMLSDEDVNFMEKLKKKELNSTEAHISLGRLIKILSIYFQKQVVVLIDEYDRLMLHGRMTETNVQLLYKSINKLINNIFQPEIKPLILRGLIVGTQRGSFNKHASFPQNVVPQWWMDEEVITLFFGFSDKEVESLFLKYHCGFEDENAFKDYYSHYETALEEGLIIYNPYAAAIYFANKPSNKNLFVDHWFLQIDNEHYLDGLFP